MKVSKKKGESGTIQYRTVERARVLGEKDIVGTPVRVIPYNQRTLTTADMAKQITHSTTLTPADVKAVLASLSNEIGNALLNGQRVSLDGVGTLNISLSINRRTPSGRLKPQKTVGDDLKGTEIVINKVLFTPSPELKERLKEATFVSSGLSSSTEVDYEEVDKWLGEWFATHFSLTRRQLEGHFSLSRRNAYNILSTLISKGKLRARGAQNTRFYTPGEGCYLRPKPTQDAEKKDQNDSNGQSDNSNNHSTEPSVEVKK